MKIGSDNIDEDSPEAVWTIDVHSCLVKENDWVDALATAETITYDTREPLDTLTPIKTFEYKGPSLEDCSGDPELTIAGADGVDIAFITAVYAEGNIVITIPSTLTD